MLANLRLGTALIALTVVIQTVGLMALARLMTRIVRWFQLHRHGLGRVIAMVATVLGLFALHTVEIWVWAITLVLVHATGRFEDALYLSTVSFSTFGADKEAATSGWRLLVA